MFSCQSVKRACNSLDTVYTMASYSLFAVLIALIIVMSQAMSHGYSKKQQSPPHCTQVSKDTDYVSNFKFDYPVAYILPGQHEAYQQMFCVNPPAVNKAVTTVCDWAAPPQVQFTLGDDYMHVVRQDPTGRFAGNAVITTYQLCSHNIPPHLVNNSDVPMATTL